MKFTIILLTLLTFSFMSCGDSCDDGVTFEENLEGSWDYSVFGSSGTVQFNSDGTYEDVTNTIVSGSTIIERTWRIEGSTLIVDSGNASLNLAWKSFDCETIVFDGQGFGDITFTK